MIRTRLIVPVAAAAAIAAGASQGQTTCADFDINGDGIVTLSDYFPAMTLCILADGPACDFDGDGDSDAADYAFYIANFDQCRAVQSGSTRTTLPILTFEDRLIAVDVSDQADLDAGYREHEIRFQLPSADAELISVVDASFGCDAPPCFIDPQNTSIYALTASLVASLGVTGDTYITIGDRSGEPAPANILAIIDEPLFAAGTAIQTAELGWTLFAAGSIDTPTSPGLGSADGNINNTVVLLGVAQTAPAMTGTFDVAYTINGQLIINRSSVSTAECTPDTNGDGMLTPADFNAWILAFNNQLPACDQNGDGLCTPADFNAWIANFNAGCD